MIELYKRKSELESVTNRSPLEQEELNKIIHLLNFYKQEKDKTWKKCLESANNKETFTTPHSAF